MTKGCADKKPRGRPPAGAVLVDGTWQLTEESQRIAAKRVLKAREKNREKYREMRQLLHHSHPELFETQKDLQTKERNGDLTRWGSMSAAKTSLDAPRS